MSLAVLSSNILLASALAGVPAAFAVAPPPACNGSTFDTFTPGSVNGQGGWSVSGPYDQAVVANTYGYATFGCQAFRLSNAVTSGGFGDQTFSPSNANEAGETGATNGGLSGGTRQNHFEATFDIASTQATEQPGLFLSVSPDRGDGSRMSYLGFGDTPGGIDVTFYDVQGTTDPANFVPTVIATGLSRATPHTAKFVIDYVDGPSNDVVQIYIDGALVHTGTTWENYYRYDSEASAEQTTRTTDSLLFRAGGGAVPATSGNGFLFDNVKTGVDVTAPASPTHLTPANNSTLTSAQLDKIDWTDVTDSSAPVTYYYEVANDPATNPDGSLVSPVYSSSALSASEIATAGTPPGTYYWHVRAVDAAGNSSAWSAPWKITVDNSASPAITFLGFRNQADGTYDNTQPILACGSTNASGYIAFEWTESGTSANQPLSYEYKIISGPTAVGTTVTTSNTHVNGGIPMQGTYTVQVTPTDSIGHIGTPVPCTVTYDSSYVPPSIPSAPLFWTEEDATQVKIDWNASAGATSYRIYRSTDDVSYNLVQTSTGTSFTDTVSGNSDYYYKVSATNSAGESATGAIAGKYSGTHDIVIDDDGMAPDFLSSGTVSKTGSWTPYDVTYPDTGVDSILSFTTGGENYSVPGAFAEQTFSWTTNATLTGMYKVYTSYICDSSRGTASYDVYSGTGKLTVTPVAVSQALRSSDGGICGSQTDPSAQPHWKLLGTYAFNGIGKVTFASGIGDNLVADAVAFEAVTGDSSSSSSVSSSSSSSLVACTTSGLSGYWKFNEGTGTTTMDSTGLGHDGTLQNGTAWASGNPAVSPNPFSLSFDGTDDIVNVTNSNDYNYGSQDFTVSTFVRTTTGNRSVLGNFSPAFKGWGLYIYNTNQVNFFGYGTMGNNDAAKPAVVLDGNWHHITGVYHHTGNDLTIDTYVDGVLAGSTTATVGDISANSTLYFGQYLPQPSLNGGLDDIRIYNRALTAGEVAALSGGCSNPVVSSSSSSSVSEGSSSSEAPSDNLSAPSGLSLPNTSPGSGSFRGSRTNILGGIIGYLGKKLNGGTTPPGGFGGASNLPYTKDEKVLICSIKHGLPARPSDAILNWVAGALADQMTHSQEQILQALNDDNFCDFQATARTRVSAATPIIPFRISASGFPVTDNATWNACITGKVTLQDIRNNPDKDQHGRGLSCATYHTGDLWMLPGSHALFTWNSKTKQVTLPVGYALQKDKGTY